MRYVASALVWRIPSLYELVGLTRYRVMRYKYHEYVNFPLMSVFMSGCLSVCMPVASTLPNHE